VRRHRVALGAAAAAIAAAVLAGVFVVPRLRTPVTPAAPGLDPNRVVVVPFENRTGDTDYEVIGLMVADWLTQGIPEAAGVTFVAGSSAVAAARRIGGGQGSALAVAREVGAGTVIAGAYYRDGDQLQIKAEVAAADSGQLLHSVEPVNGPISEPMSVVEPLRQSVLGLLAGRDPVISQFVPPTFEAYREFVIARDMWIEHPDAALEHFQRSLELDPDFLPAQLYSVHPLMHLGRREEAWSLLDGLDARREELNRYDRLFVDSIRLYYERRYAEALPVFRDIVTRDPLNPHLRSGHGQVARWTNRPQEAVTTLEAQGDWHELGFPQLYSLCDALHMLGQHRRELEVARHAVASFPGHMYSAGSEARALAALGRTDEVARLVEESSPGSETLQIRLAREVSLELRAHGSTEAAREMAEKTLARFSSSEGITLRARWCLATLMWVAERPEDARSAFADLLSERPDDVTFVGSLGMAAAHLGDRDTAQIASRRLALEEVENPQFVGEDHYRLACIAAGLGNLEEAVDHLHAALKAGARFSPEFHRDPFLDPLRGFEPFEEFLRPKG
jgi:tetratricopeptide (TPR) repeat protein/TolB-like protein